MARFSAIKQADPVSYTAQMGPESVTVTFDAALMTGRWERDVNRAIQAADSEKVVEMLFGVFISWDVVDDNNQPVPMTSEVLLDLPNKALLNLMNGMRDAAAPASEEGNGSGSTSSIPDTASISLPVSPPNGLPTSPSPPLSASPSPT